MPASWILALVCVHSWCGDQTQCLLQVREAIQHWDEPLALALVEMQLWQPSAWVHCHAERVP
jgi:hypothetical protein